MTFSFTFLNKLSKMIADDNISSEKLMKLVEEQQEGSIETIKELMFNHNVNKKIEKIRKQYPNLAIEDYYLDSDAYFVNIYALELTEEVIRSYYKVQDEIKALLKENNIAGDLEVSLNFYERVSIDQ